MSDKIDWSQAPEWANARIRNRVTPQLMAWAESYTEDVIFLRDDCVGTVCPRLAVGCWKLVAARPTTPSWSGEGLPPAGVACKIIGGDSKWWSYSGFERGDIVTVRHSFKNSKGSDMVVVEGCDGGCLAVTVDCVEVIRTPEQIAADDRDEAIKRACADIDKLVAAYNMSIDCSAAIRATIEALYDAGFRKT